MKSIFDIILIIFITLSMFISMLFFSEEVLIQQQAIHIRNRVINLVEIESGYTEEVKKQLETDLKDFPKEITINTSKKGKLLYGEKLEVEVLLVHKRKLPFMNNIEKNIVYKSKGVYYNVNP